MSLETVVEDITDEARERAREIREAAEQRAEEIVSDAEADADEIIAEAEDRAENRIAQERDQKLSSAKLEAKQMRLEARRDVLQEVRETVEDRIANLEGDQREELTRVLLSAAAEEYGDAATVRVYGRPDDQDLIESILDDADYEGFEYAGEYDCLGGVVVESEGSRVRVNNTFDSVLEDVWDDDLREVSDRLFEEE